MNTALIEVYQNDERIALYHSGEINLMEVSMAVMKGLTAYQNEGKEECLAVLTEALNVVTEGQGTYTYKLYPEKNAFEVWQEGEKVAARNVKVKNPKPKPKKKTSQGDGAMYLGHWNDNNMVQLQWGIRSIYNYFLDNPELLRRYLWLRSVAGENKAALWLKAHATRFEKVEKVAKEG